MNANQGSSQKDVTAEEIIAMCRAEIESLHNLQYLFRIDADNPEAVRQYAEMMDTQLQRVTDLLCRRASVTA